MSDLDACPDCGASLLGNQLRRSDGNVTEAPTPFAVVDGELVIEVALSCRHCDWSTEVRFTPDETFEVDYE